MELINLQFINFVLFFYNIREGGYFMIACVLVELQNKKLDKMFDYNVPKDLEKYMKIGIRVKVPFGRQNLEGFVLDFKDKSDFELRNISYVVDKDIVLTPDLLRLGKIMKEKTYSSLISCYQTMLPKALKASYKTDIKIKYDTFYELNNTCFNLTPKMKEVVSLFSSNKMIPRKDVIEKYRDVKKLVDIGLLKEVKKEHYRLNYDIEKNVRYELTPDQKSVYEEFINTDDSVYLLHGVTGSGKTEVYMEIIDYYLKMGKTSIVLVPEISLTPQMVERFTKRFGNIVAALHSALSDGERYDEWRRISRGDAKIVIGARSALFCPLKNIGVIIIDEEHSDSYIQDDASPHYNAIELAIIRAKDVHAKVMLGSATPSLESYARAKKKVYHLLSLTKRATGAPLPDVKIIDMNYGIRNATGPFSQELIDAIKKKIDKKEQIILLLNRRGYSRVVTCKNCGYTYKCPNCDIALTYHKSSNNLRCHYCGYASNVDDLCPSCHSKTLSSFGIGTEKVEEYLNKIFPSARVLRMDYDTTTRKGSHKKMLDAFKDHKYDILLGTQIVAKGLDFENVTLVGIINADTSLNIPNYRSSEETFSLISQTAGRCGRKGKKGTVYIQTFNKDHYAIKYAEKHDYIGFYREEMKIRHTLKYPPYYYILYIKISGKDNMYTYNESLRIKKSFEKHLKDEIILGPSTTGILKINNVFHYGIIIKYKEDDNIRKVLTLMEDAYISNNKIKIDIIFNPRHF